MLRNVLVGCAAIACSLFIASAVQAGVAGGIALLADFDGDGETDVGVYDTTNGDWFVNQSGGVFLTIPGFGGPNSIPVPADYDGDGDADPAIHDTTNGDWFAVEVVDAATFNFNLLLVVPAFGGNGETPVPADYNGDGIADTAIYDPSNGNWILNVDPANPGNAEVVGNFGGPGFTPVPGDYDGDGEVDEAVQETATGQWSLNQSTDGFDNSITSFAGGGTFSVFARDFDGDGADDPSAYDTTNGDWFAELSGGGIFSLAGFGGVGFSPVGAFWDTDSTSDPGIYDDAQGDWFFDLSATMMTEIVPAFGGANYVPSQP